MATCLCWVAKSNPLHQQQTPTIVLGLGLGLRLMLALALEKVLADGKSSQKSSPSVVAKAKLLPPPLLQPPLRLALPTVPFLAWLPPGQLLVLSCPLWTPLMMMMSRQLLQQQQLCHYHHR